MELKPMYGSENAVCWFAMDYAEDEYKLEHLAVRFKTADIKKDFQEKFEACQKELKDNPPPKTNEEVNWIKKHIEHENKNKNIHPKKKEFQLRTVKTSPPTLLKGIKRVDQIDRKERWKCVPKFKILSSQAFYFISP